MKIIEEWGSGISRILRECSGHGLPEPEFVDFDGDFRINMHRPLPEKDWYHADDTNDTNDTNRDTNDTNHDTKILSLIREKPSITQAEIKENLQVSIVTAKRLMADLQKRGLIERQGSSRKGKWIITGQKEQTD